MRRLRLLRDADVVPAMVVVLAGAALLVFDVPLAVLLIAIVAGEVFGAPLVERDDVDGEA